MFLLPEAGVELLLIPYGLFLTPELVLILLTPDLFEALDGSSSAVEDLAWELRLFTVAN